MIQSRLDFILRENSTIDLIRNVSSKVEISNYYPSAATITFSIFKFLNICPITNYSRVDIQTWGLRKGDIVSVSSDILRMLPVIIYEVLPTLPALSRCGSSLFIDSLVYSGDLKEDAICWSDINERVKWVAGINNVFLISSLQFPTKVFRGCS